MKTYILEWRPQTSRYKMKDFTTDFEDWHPGALREKGFTKDVVETLLFSHEKDVPYLDYIKAIIDSGDRTALAVKVHDLRHNLLRAQDGGTPAS